MFLLDANVFIQAKNQYYAMDICPGFWDWLDQANGRGELASITSIADELKTGPDELAAWAKNRVGSEWFLGVDDGPTQNALQAIAAHVAAGPYTAAAQSVFLGCADPWLIAKAVSQGATLVTHEQHRPHAISRIMIPNVCKVFGVEWRDTFDVLRHLSASFVLDRPAVLPASA